MIICDNRKFAFIHVYKTAGTSIRNYLGRNFKIRNVWGPHIPIAEMHQKDPKTKDYFTFAFVRNPWDWQVSLYYYTKASPNHRHHKAVKKKTFPEYLKWLTDMMDDKNSGEKNFRQQDYLLKSGKIAVDFVGRFETLNEDFDKILHKIGGPTNKLPHSNKGKRPAYREMYTDETRDLVAKYWADDIKLFGYSY